MKLLLSAIIFVASATNFAQSDDRCLCVLADNANCPAKIPAKVIHESQTFCFGGYKRCTSFYDAITCYKNDGSNDAYIIGIVSCNVGCTPPPPSWPFPAPPTPTPPGDTPSSAGNIGMGYVWFVAAAAAFAGIN